MLGKWCNTAGLVVMILKLLIDCLIVQILFGDGVGGKKGNSKKWCWSTKQTWRDIETLMMRIVRPDIEKLIDNMLKFSYKRNLSGNKEQKLIG
jgi:hypothetical protein